MNKFHFATLWCKRIGVLAGILITGAVLLVTFAERSGISIGDTLASHAGSQIAAPVAATTPVVKATPPDAQPAVDTETVDPQESDELADDQVEQVIPVDVDQALEASVSISTVDQLAAVVAPKFDEHPLTPVIRAARTALNRMHSIRDYSATLVAQERVDGQLNPKARMPIKVRHDPFSVYISYLEPSRMRGQECLYVAGRNNNKLLAHTTGLKHRLVGTIALNPTGDVAMAGNRYPITEVGIRRLVERIIEVSEREASQEDCEVTVLPSIEINGRDCPGVQIVHAEKRELFLYHKVKVYIDPQWSFPVRFESYDWPTAADQEPQLLEEYTYHDLKLNQEFTDEDFSQDNPSYYFARGR